VLSELPLNEFGAGEICHQKSHTPCPMSLVPSQQISLPQTWTGGLLRAEAAKFLRTKEPENPKGASSHVEKESDVG
jgi:hypothetical protein